MSCPICYRNFLFSVAKVVGLIILFTSIINTAQALTSPQISTDSLVQVINTSSGIKKVDALNNAAEYIQKFSAKEAMPLAEQALAMAEKLLYINGKAKALQNMAIISSSKGDKKEAVVLARRALLIYEQCNEHEAVFNCLLTLAYNYMALGKKALVVETELKAFHLAGEIERIDLQSFAASSLSQFFTKMNDKSSALIYASKAMMLSKIDKNPLSSGHAYMAMANYINNFGQKQSACGYFQRALKYFIAANQLFGTCKCYMHLGSYYIDINDLDSAKTCYLNALKLAKQSNHIMTQSAIYSIIAHIYQLDNKMERALVFQRKALKLRKEYGNLPLTGSSLSNIGTVYTNIGNYPKALEYFHAGLKIAKLVGHTDYIKYNYQHIYELYISSKNYKKALEYNLLLSAINDTILQNDARQKFAEINYIHEVGQKQNAIGLLSKENEMQNLRLKQTRVTIYVLGAIILLFLIIVVLLDIKAKLNARHRQMDIEQKLLRSQMNPHFIFNALVAIQSFIYKKESGEAAKYLSSFARLIRLVLSNSREEFVTLKCEIETLSNYLLLQKLRFENKFDYTMVVDPRLDSELIYVPPMLAQPFVENAIEHGIFGMEAQGHIVIIIRKKDNSILIEVNDNGIGRKKGTELRKKSDKTHESLALRITEERISSLNRKYSSRTSLHITDILNDKKEQAGTSVLLTIPLRIEGYH